MGTWNYATELDEIKEIPDEWVWERLRLRRDSLLAQSDFRMVTDAPWEIEPWVAYRQALRNLPKNTKDPREAKWPVAPNE